MRSCSAWRSRRTRIGTNPAPKNRKLRGNTSTRTTACRGSSSRPSDRTTRRPRTALPNVRPLAARGTAKYRNDHTAKVTLAASGESATSKSIPNTSATRYSKTDAPTAKRELTVTVSITYAARRVTAPA
jgi:hypothetical protein